MRLYIMSSSRGRLKEVERCDLDFRSESRVAKLQAVSFSEEWLTHQNDEFPPICVRMLCASHEKWSLMNERPFANVLHNELAVRIAVLHITLTQRTIPMEA
uniref:Uncharacterized protein n=1 Tax=Ascaris lumbricoides TaxID=6252 RepID=A0A0M3HQ40_ASCLU